MLASTVRARAETRRRAKAQKQREQSQGVIENKGHHFFERYKLWAFDTPIYTRRMRRGAKTVRLAQTSRSCPSADGHPETMKMREAPWSAAA